MARFTTRGRVTHSATLAVLVASIVAGCSGGSDSTGGADGTETSTGRAPTPTFVGDPNSAWCVSVPEFNSAAGNLSRLDLVNATPDEIEETFTSMIDEVDKLKTDAPPEIATDVKQFSTDLDQFRDLLADAGYDIGAAEPARLAELNAKIAASSATIDGYNRSVCGKPATG